MRLNEDCTGRAFFLLPPSVHESFSGKLIEFSLPAESGAGIAGVSYGVSGAFQGVHPLLVDTNTFTVAAPAVKNVRK